MWQEPVWHEIILEEPEVWGVQELSSDAVLMRVTARTVPLRQWEVQRELTERLKLALDAAGAINGAGARAEPGGRSGAVAPAASRALPDPHPAQAAARPDARAPDAPAGDAPARPAPGASASGSPPDPAAE
jgi:moderate conductance mechanosensitive channel